MEILGAIGLAGRELWNYNRELFKYDQDQRLERDLAALEMKVKQFELYREDIRDLVELTVGRMDIYHLVGAMLLEFTVVFYCEGRIHAIAPPWILMMFFGCLSSAFVFLILAVWLSMHASVCSHSFGVRLLTRFVRLPIPSAETLNQARTKYAQFERSGFKNMFRIPFVTEKAQVWEGDAENAGAADQAGVASELQKDDTMDAAATTTLAEVGQAMLPLGHVELYRQLQSRWQCYDAYARVCMSLGVNQIIHALCTFIAAHMVVEQFAPFAVFFTVVPLEVCNLLLLNLDVREAQRWEFVLGLICTFGPVLLATVSLVLEREYKKGDAAVAVSEFLACTSFMLYALWYIVVKRFATPEEVNGIALPFRFRAVLYLDVFGDVLPQKRIPAKSKAIEEEKEEIIAALEAACNNKASPLEAMQDLQSAAVRGVEFLDVRGHDAQMERSVTKAAVFFEEQKFRIEEEEVRARLDRWRSAKVQSYLPEQQKCELEKLAGDIKAAMDKVKKLTSRRARPLTAEEEFHYNKMANEISVGGGIGRNFANFGNAVKKLVQMANEFEQTVERFRAGSQIQGMELTSPHGTPRSSLTGQAAVGTAPSAKSTTQGPTPIIEMHDLSTKTPEFKMVTEHLERDQSFYPNIRQPERRTGSFSFLGPLRRSVTFFGGAVSTEASPAGEDFTGTNIVDVDTSSEAPETLPWGSVRVMLNVLLLSWCACSLLTLGNAIKPGGPIWGLDVDNEEEHGHERKMQFLTLQSSWPTPHFEVDRLHCLDQVYVENPYGSTWNTANYSESQAPKAERKLPGQDASAIATFGNDTVAARAGKRVLIYLSFGAQFDAATAKPAYALPIGGEDVKFIGLYRLAVLGNNFLSLWDLKTGEQLDGWKVAVDSKAFCHTADHVYIGSDRGLHRAPLPSEWRIAENPSSLTE
eukprot:GEMP01002535.1.p1 GENE.GEMP01002535.1~~GEMP01002535.1.p1  ORF type:complete len:922 (+),score=223.84 GEMP01002535.1:144-2909(+)